MGIRDRQVHLTLTRAHCSRNGGRTAIALLPLFLLLLLLLLVLGCLLVGWYWQIHRTYSRLLCLNMHMHMYRKCVLVSRGGSPPSFLLPLWPPFYPSPLPTAGEF